MLGADLHFMIRSLQPLHARTHLVWHDTPSYRHDGWQGCGHCLGTGKYLAPFDLTRRGVKAASRDPCHSCALTEPTTVVGRQEGWPDQAKPPCFRVLAVYIHRLLLQLSLRTFSTGRNQPANPPTSSLYVSFLACNRMEQIQARGDVCVGDGLGSEGGMWHWSARENGQGAQHSASYR